MAQSYHQQAVSLSFRAEHILTVALVNLGSVEARLFNHLSKKEHLDKSISCFEQAMSLMSDYRKKDNYLHPHVVERLAVAYGLMYKYTQDADHVKKSVVYAEQALQLTPKAHCLKALHLSNLGTACVLQYQRLGQTDFLRQSIQYTEQALAVSSNGIMERFRYLKNLSQMYQELYGATNTIDFLDKSISYGEQAALHATDGNPENSSYFFELGTAYHVLFNRLGDKEHIFKAVKYLEKRCKLLSDSHWGKPISLGRLGEAYNAVYRLTGSLDYLQQSIGTLDQAILLAHEYSNPEKTQLLCDKGDMHLRLSWGSQLSKETDKAIECYALADLLIPNGHPQKAQNCSALGSAYAVLFRQQGRPEHLTKATSFLRQAVMLTEEGFPSKSTFLVELAHALVESQACEGLASRDIIEEALDLLRHAALMITGQLSIRLHATEDWARLSTSLGHSPLEAFSYAMTLLPRIVWLGVPVRLRYVFINQNVRRIAKQAITAAITSQRYDLAVEWLDQSRCFVWGQLLQLRTPLQALHSIDPEMAVELESISQELVLTSVRQPGERGLTETGLSVHEAAQRYRQLATRREELIESVQRIPGLEDFLRPLEVSEIFKSKKRGFIVLLNSGQIFYDAIVIWMDSQTITHVPLERILCKDMEIVQHNLFTSLRTRGSRRPIWSLDSHSNTPLKDLLRMLWYDVVKPILAHLNITQALPVDTLPHIAWCIAGPLSFLPVHAAGDYRSPDEVLPNLVISSYIPNISSVYRQNAVNSTFTGMLSIGLAASVRGLEVLPGTKAELDQIEKHLTGLHHTRLDEEEASSDAVLNAMAEHSWVHFACHASQDQTNPLSSALRLHDKDLDLATIYRTPIKNAQLAFLSACQTATGDSSLPDEVVHLAAGLFMAGYPHVIATMWSISDNDAPIIAGKFYECLLEDGAPNAHKAAIALHKATAHLRDEIGVEEFARWVPFIHIGHQV